MPKLEVLENKKLVLKNVLQQTLKNVGLEVLEEEISKFNLLLRKFSVQTFGPLVIKNSGMNISEDAKMTIDYDLLIQAHNYKEFKSAFEPIERLEVPYCIYVRFEGNPEDIQFAHSKLDLHFYENDIESTGEIYSVIIEDSENHSIIDIFRPVKVL